MSGDLCSRVHVLRKWVIVFSHTSRPIKFYYLQLRKLWFIDFIMHVHVHVHVCTQCTLYIERRQIECFRCKQKKNTESHIKQGEMSRN